MPSGTNWDGDRSHGWQILTTQPLVPTRKVRKQAPITLIKEWKKEGTGERERT